MACNKCKQKPANKITNLQTHVDFNRIETAYNYLQIQSTMTNEKWDFVEEVVNELYPQKYPLNRSCTQCLQHFSKLITTEYNKRKLTSK